MTLNLYKFCLVYLAVPVFKKEMKDAFAQFNYFVLIL